MQMKCSTSEALPAHVSLLDEAGKHLGFHEHFQKSSQTLGSDRFAKGLPLKGRGRRGAGQGGGGDGLVLPVRSAHEERVVSHHLNKETDKGLWDHRAERAGVWQRKPGEKKSKNYLQYQKFLLDVCSRFHFNIRSSCGHSSGIRRNMSCSFFKCWSSWLDWTLLESFELCRQWDHKGHELYCRVASHLCFLFSTTTFLLRVLSYFKAL